MFQKVRYLIHNVELIETKKPAFNKKDELNINHLHLTIGELNINYISVINCILAMVWVFHRGQKRSRKTPILQDLQRLR